MVRRQLFVIGNTLVPMSAMHRGHLNSMFYFPDRYDSLASQMALKYMRIYGVVFLHLCGFSVFLFCVVMVLAKDFSYMLYFHFLCKAFPFLAIIKGSLSLQEKCLH